MSINSICTEIAKKIPAVKQKSYDEGYAAGQESGGGGMEAFWAAFFDSQKELAQIGTFGSAGWNEQTFKPDRTINATNLGTGNANSLFGRSGFVNFPAHLSDGVTPVLDTSGFTTMGSIFGNCMKLKSIKAVLNLKNCTNMTTAFSGDKLLSSVHLSHVEKVSLWTSAFKDCTSLTDIGQEEDDFGYFSASVDLSKTAIDFSKPKMSLYKMALGDFTQEDIYLLWNYKENGEFVVEGLTLTISQKQYDDAQAFLNAQYENADEAPDFSANLVGGCGWMLAVK